MSNRVRMASTIAAVATLMVLTTATAANRSYHNAGQGGAPDVGNWAWVNHVDATTHIWWMKHHWVRQRSLDRLRNGAEFEMEFFDGGNKTGCDVFHVADPRSGVVLRAPGFRATRTLSDCGFDRAKELVIIELQDKSRVPLTPSGSNIGPSWAAIAKLTRQENMGPVRCPGPGPGGACPPAPPPPRPEVSQVNLEFEPRIFSKWLGKINLARCPRKNYQATTSDPMGLAAPTICS